MKEQTISFTPLLQQLAETIIIIIKPTVRTLQNRAPNNMSFFF